jgi:UDP-2,4-diacetamido-2,4,6-trideoxy-beta-L-altropyranose hydrolase
MNRGGVNLLVRADASPQIGTGHVMRCMALSKAWQDSGGDVTFACADVLPALERRLRQQGCEIVAINTSRGSEEDVEMTADVARDLAAEWVVLDGYQFDSAYYRGLKRRNLHCLEMDDDGRLEEYCADAVLNSCASASEAMYARREPHTELLLGSRFVLLRPEFMRIARKSDCADIARRLLVTMGGSDPENVTLKVVNALSGIAREGAEVRVVAGSGYKHLEELRAIVATMPGQVAVEEDPEDMAPILAWADLAVSAAGGTCWELAYVGVPAVLIALSPDQCGIAQTAEERGMACSLGWHADISTGRIEDAVQRLSRDSESRCAMSKAGQALVDGRGPERVVGFLQSVI